MECRRGMGFFKLSFLIKMSYMESNQISTNITQFPLLGTRSDGDPFQYFPISVKDNQVRIAIFSWLVNRAILNVGEQVNLLVPFFLNSGHIREENLQGEISEMVNNLAVQAIEYQVTFPVEIKSVALENWNLDYVQSLLPLSNSLEEAFVSLIKDTMLLKSGVRIYLKHLRAYFSRISHHTLKEYFYLNSLFFADIEKHVTENEKKLENLYRELKNNLKRPEEIPIMVQLEELREMIESEISLSLVDLVFSENEANYMLSLEKLLNPLLSNRCVTYLNAIKTLEKRLYTNYNTLVLIYVKSLT